MWLHPSTNTAEMAFVGVHTTSGKNKFYLAYKPNDGYTIKFLGSKGSVFLPEDIRELQHLAVVVDSLETPQALFKVTARRS
jgi:hypothetical protein